MKTQLYILFITAFISSNFLMAQNPFASIGQDAELLTLTNGKYPEFFPNDTIRTVNGVMFNMNTQKVIGFVEKDTTNSEFTLQPEVVSRWLSPDPLAAKFPNMSPYNFAANNPILFIDPDGNVFRIYYEVTNAETGKTSQTYVDFNGTKAISENGTEYAMGTNQFVDDVITSYNYIVNNDADIEGAMNYVATAKEITEVEFTGLRGGTMYDGEGKILYNPLSGLTIINNENEGIQSPAVGFFHEVVHRYLQFTLPEEQYNELQKLSYKEKDVKKEEYEVIDNYETEAVKILKNKGTQETYRKKYSYDSKEAWTDSPTSTKRVKKSEIKDSLKNRDETSSETQ